MNIGTKENDADRLSGINLGSEEFQTSGHSATGKMQEQQQEPEEQEEDQQQQHEQPDISVQIAKEKGGFIFKYTQYILGCAGLKSEVCRRYSDFEWLLQVLQAKYPSRMTPVLPGKLYGLPSEQNLSEERRLGLQKMMEYLRWHPIFRDDDVVRVFFQVSGPEKFSWLKKSIVATDEFVTHRIKGKEIAKISEEEQAELEKFAEILPSLRIHFEKLVDIVENINNRSRRNAHDFPLLGNLFETVLKEDLTHRVPGLPEEILAETMQRVAKQEATVYKQTHREAVELLCAHETLLHLFSECWTRRLHSTVKDLRNQAKKLEFAKEKLRAATLAAATTSKGQGGYVEQLNQQVIREEEELEQLRARDQHSQHCLFEEFRLVGQSSERIMDALKGLANARKEFHQNSSMIWEQWGGTKQ